jgi:hypothetical protein
MKYLALLMITDQSLLFGIQILRGAKSIKVKFSLCLIANYTMKTYGGVMV